MDRNVDRNVAGGCVFWDGANLGMIDSINTHTPSHTTHIFYGADAVPAGIRQVLAAVAAAVEEKFPLVMEDLPAIIVGTVDGRLDAAARAFAAVAVECLVWNVGSCCGMLAVSAGRRSLRCCHVRVFVTDTVELCMRLIPPFLFFPSK